MPHCISTRQEQDWKGRRLSRNTSKPRMPAEFLATDQEEKNLKRIPLIGILLVALAGPGCIRKTQSTTLQAPSPEWLPALASKDDYMKLAHSDERNLSYVKFTLEEKTEDNKIYFQNTQKYPFHLEFLRATFPRFANLTMPEFETLIFGPATREFLAGGIFLGQNIQVPGLPGTADAMGFNIYFKDNVINVDDVAKAHARMKNALPWIADRVVYVFDEPRDFFRYRNPLQQKGVPSFLLEKFIGAGQQPIAYNAATSYGYLRKLSPAELANTEYSSKDIIVIENIPIDLSPVAGVLSSLPQVPHSHVIFRAVNMKIPDLYVPNLLQQPSVQANLGKLVKLSVQTNGQWTIQGPNDISPQQLQAEADAWFRSRIPQLPEPRADLSVSGIFDFQANKPTPNIVTGYGAKGTNFALLDSALREANIDRGYFAGGFLLPYSFYAKHMNQTLPIKACDKGSRKCAEDYGDACSAAVAKCSAVANARGTLGNFIQQTITPETVPSLLGDPRLRKATLYMIQYAIKKTPLEVGVQGLLEGEMARRWTPTSRIRFRSSSNAEDMPGLTGAGLYTSKSGCLADKGKDDGAGSSCMTPTERARTQARIAKLTALNDPTLAALIKDLQDSLTDVDTPEDGLRGVYASLWNERAFLSRDYYAMDHHKVYMGVLVHPSFVDETANGVAVAEEINGQFQVDAVVQADDISITNPEVPGAVPERIIATLAPGAAQLASLKRISQSNQVAGGTVLSDAQVLSLVQQMDIVYRAFRQFYGDATRRLDLELIRGAQGQMLIKQARPL